MDAVLFRVFGRVQGVGFRDFTRRRALELRLAGWVRNVEDGSVEVWAQGARPGIDELRRRLERGPAGARVDRVDERDVEPDPSLRDFGIRHD